MIRKTCKSGKTRYDSVHAAYRALTHIAEKPARTFDFYRPNGVVSCTRCKGFHLTSKSGKQHRSGKRGRNLRVRTYRQGR